MAYLDIFCISYYQIAVYYIIASLHLLIIKKWKSLIMMVERFSFHISNTLSYIIIYKFYNKQIKVDYYIVRISYFLNCIDFYFCGTFFQLDFHCLVHNNFPSIFFQISNNFLM